MKVDIAEFNWHFSSVLKHGTAVIEELVNERKKSDKLGKELEALRKAIKVMPRFERIFSLADRVKNTIPEYNWEARKEITEDYKIILQDVKEQQVQRVESLKKLLTQADERLEDINKAIEEAEKV